MNPSPKNRTGTFLGMEANIEALPAVTTPRRQGPKIAPLQSSRGRYVRTSAEASRHKRVEAIREKETYRGFAGLSLNTAQRPKTSPAACHYMKKNSEQKDAPTNEELIELTRRNPRQFTAVNNHGVAHREYLTYTPEVSQNRGLLPVDLAASLLQASDVKGPTKYYNTLCQNNPEALKTLLGNKKFGWPTNQYTGFHIRSYRKPPTAHILADLDQMTTPHYRRPKTAITVSNKELLVPQPYIYRSASNAAKRVAFKSAGASVQPQPITFSEVNGLQLKLQKSRNASRSEEVVDMYSKTERSLNPSPQQVTHNEPAADGEKQPSADSEKQSAADGENHSLADGDTQPSADGDNQPSADGDNQPSADGDNQPSADGEKQHSADGDNQPPADGEKQPSADGDKQPAADGEIQPTTDVQKPSTSQTTEFSKRLGNDMPMMEDTLMTGDTMSDTKHTRVLTPKINIAIETDDGDIHPPVIDDIEEVFCADENSETTSCNEAGRRNSMSERLQKIKVGEDLANSVKIKAEQRKKVLEDLLAEHEHLVKQVIVSADNKHDTVAH